MIIFFNSHVDIKREKNTSLSVKKTSVQPINKLIGYELDTFVKKKYRSVILRCVEKIYL